MKRLLSLAVLGLAVQVATAQFVSYSGGVYSQNFDSLSNVSPGNHTWTDGVAPLLGWYEHRSNNQGLYRATDGSADTGYIYSFGAVGSTERALGSLSTSATGTVFWGVRIRNTHPNWTFTSFTLEFYQEQWRVAANDAVQTTFFQYKISTTDTDVNGSGYTGVSSGDLVSTITQANFSGTAPSALDGNANRILRTVVVTGINWAPGEDLWLRWRDPNNDGTDHAMGIDDLTFAAVPEPATFALVGVGMGGVGVVARRLRRNRHATVVA